MTVLTKQINLIERIDQLIRLEATGNPSELAKGLEISRAKLYRMIELMKELQAPIRYDFAIQSFIYEEAVDFRCGFYTEVLNPQEIRQISGGISLDFKKLQVFLSVS